MQFDICIELLISSVIFILNNGTCSFVVSSFNFNRFLHLFLLAFLYSNNVYLKLKLIYIFSLLFDCSTAKICDWSDYACIWYCKSPNLSIYQSELVKVWNWLVNPSILVFYCSILFNVRINWYFFFWALQRVQDMRG